MEDETILDLYFAREERAIAETGKKRQPLTAQMLRVCRTCPAPTARWPLTPAICSTTKIPTAQAASR